MVSKVPGVPSGFLELAFDLDLEVEDLIFAMAKSQIKALKSSSNNMLSGSVQKFYVRNNLKFVRVLLYLLKSR